MAERACKETYWNATAEEDKAFPRLSGDLTVDTAVIGGGIVGITTARLLKDMGRTVAVLEARRVGRQVTGGSTAKVTSQHGLIYQTLAKKFGEDRARLYAEAQESGVRTIERLAAAHEVACDLQPAAAFAYTQQEANYARAFPQAEPVIAARIRRVPEGMYINVEEPSFSIRTHARDNGDVYGIVAGTSFKPGHVEDERKHFASIEAWLTDHFEAGPVEFRWVNEDYKSMDSAPFIGWSAAPGRGYLVATGFDAWGISSGTAAAMILADLATERENPWLAIFDARRMKPVAGGVEFVKENAATAVHLVSGLLSRKPASLDALAPGDAAILKLDGKQVVAFRDEQGRVHAVSAVCTHMGCVLGWNETDRTWDCACHGSRFGLDGDVIHGPAVTPLDIHTPG